MVYHHALPTNAMLDRKSRRTNLECVLWVFDAANFRIEYAVIKAVTGFFYQRHMKIDLILV